MLYSNIKLCKSYTVNEKNRRKKNKLCGIKEDLHLNNVHTLPCESETKHFILE